MAVSCWIGEGVVDCVPASTMGKVIKMIAVDTVKTAMIIHIKTTYPKTSVFFTSFTSPVSRIDNELYSLTIGVFLRVICIYDWEY